MTYLPCVELQTDSRLPAQAAVIWLHGLGADGHDFASLVPQLKLPADRNIRFIFPHAPSIPVTVNNGYVMPAWYDILEMSLDRKVDVAQLRASAQQIVALIERESARGIAGDKIIIAGFSQGGAVAYEVALSYAKPLAGLLVLSSYLATGDTLVASEANKKIPILIQHGSQDSVVNEALGQRAFRQLSDLGYAVAYESYEMDHTLCIEQIQSISRWLSERLQ
ncbi:MAG TPA: alpha/beta fold hydrolase [Cellvibrio sp.]|nr:alpha/beta fold hydrolase [Cellvibrio sp.]